MKKLIMIFTIIISFFIFDILFKEESREEWLQQKNFKINETLPDKEEISIAFYLDGKDPSQFFSRLRDFSYQNTTLSYIVVNKNLSKFNSESNIYLLSKNNDAIDDFFTIQEKQTIDFSNYSNEFYTSNLSDKKSDYHIRFLNRFYNKTFNDVLNVYPFEAYKMTSALRENNSTYVHFFVKNKEQFINALESSTLSNYINNSGITDINGEGHLEEVKEGDELSLRILIMVSLATLLLVIGEVIHKKKEITLRKMFGMSNISIMKKMFLPEFLIIFSMYICTQILCYMSFIGNFYQNSIAFIFLLLRVLFLFLFVLLMIAFFLYLVIVKITNINVMKRERENKKILIFNLILKTLAILLLMQPTILQTVNVIESTRMYTIMKDNEESITRCIYRGAINTDGEIGNTKFMNQKQLVLDYFNEHGGYFQNFDTYYFSKTGTGLTNDNYRYPYLEANLNYLLEYTIKDEEGKKVNIGKLSQDTLLIPLMYKDKDLSDYEGNPIIYIEDGITFSRNSISPNSDSFYTKDPIIKVFTKIPMNHPMSDSYMSVMLPIKNEKEMEKFKMFSKEVLDNKVEFGSNEIDFKLVISQITDKLILSWTLILIQVVTILIFLFETVYMYLVQEKNLYSLRYMFGGSFVERYGGMILSNMSVYVVALIISLFVYKISLIHLLLFIGITLVFEFLITGLLIHKFEKKSIVRSLKGE